MPNEREASDLEGKGEVAYQIADGRFVKDVRQLIQLRTFLIREVEGLTVEQSAALKLGELNDLVYAPAGRRPTAAEWDKVEVATQSMYSILSEPLRKKFALGEVSPYMMTFPVLLVISAAVALIFALYLQTVPTWKYASSASVFVCYIVWVIALGGMGSIAFISMNSLSVQQDATFDMTNGRLLLLRIMTGALFAMVLALPFGHDKFMGFLQTVIRNSEARSGDSATSGTISVTQQALFLILPFVLGFSTSLVILVMNRLVEAAQMFFGKGPLTADAVKEVRQAKIVSPSRPSGLGGSSGSDIKKPGVTGGPISHPESA
jgi:hypothetical protein